MNIALAWKIAVWLEKAGMNPATVDRIYRKMIRMSLRRVWPIKR